MKKIIETVLFVLLLVLFFDFVCFILWGVSGQHPVDGFYFGTISAHILNFIF